MSLEHYTYQAQRVITDVLDKIGDASQVQVTSDMILRWINDGTREISADHTFYDSSATLDLLQGTATYDLGALPRIKQVDTITINGKPLSLESQASLLKRIAAVTIPNQPPASPGTPTFGAVRNGILTLWPTPSTTKAGGIIVYFSQWPAEIAAATDTLTLPDRFYNALVNYVLAQASTLVGASDVAQEQLRLMDASARTQFGKDTLPTDFYGTITYDSDGY